MKKLVYILSVFAVGIFTFSCEDYDFEEDQGFNLEQLPKYVAFNGDGNTVTLDTFDIDEEDDEIEISIEAPTFVRSALTVTYSLSGSAVFGTDYTIEGATASGGTITLDPEPANIQDFVNGDLMFTPLTDNVVDGEKMVTITLESAVDADGEVFAVGRGGTDFLKSATVRIADVD